MEIQALPPSAVIPPIPKATPTTTADSLPASDIDSTFNPTTTDLIAAPLGSRIVSYSDDFFAEVTNLTNPDPPIRKPGVFVETGAWYDGWETRRHNASPPDYVTIRLGPAAGVPKGIEIDTAFFDGNHAEHVSVLGAYETGEDADEVVKKEGYTRWRTLLGKRECGPSRRHAWFVENDEEVTHVKLEMWPDGGIARFRLYGTAVPIWPSSPDEEVELSAVNMGGAVVEYSDQHFGRAGNLLLPGRGKDMGDGWETRRSREVGHTDWVIVRLGARGRVGRVVMDTMHFRGNFPRGCRVLGLDARNDIEVNVNKEDWRELGSVERCERDREHEVKLGREGIVCTHMKLVIEPDGGVKRFRVFGVRV
ncbi:MAG: hypothetical protein Q9217_002185 [Psora testacea]